MYILYPEDLLISLDAEENVNKVIIQEKHSMKCFSAIL